MIHCQHSRLFLESNGEGVKNQRLFSQLVNNLKTLPVYSFSLYSRQTTVGGGEERRRQSAVKWRGREEEGSVIGEDGCEQREVEGAEGMLNTGEEREGEQKMQAYQGRWKGKK